MIPADASSETVAMVFERLQAVVDGSVTVESAPLSRGGARRWVRGVWGGPTYPPTFDLQKMEVTSMFEINIGRLDL